MSMYADDDQNALAYEIERFLENHSISELLTIVTDMVVRKEDN